MQDGHRNYELILMTDCNSNIMFWTIKDCHKANENEKP